MEIRLIHTGSETTSQEKPASTGQERKIEIVSVPAPGHASERRHRAIQIWLEMAHRILKDSGKEN